MVEAHHRPGQTILGILFSPKFKVSPTSPYNITFQAIRLDTGLRECY